MRRASDYRSAPQLITAISVAQPQRGEEIILFTEKPSPSRKDLLEKSRANGISELCVPKSLVETKIPDPRHRQTGLPDTGIPACRNAAI
jgi:hypothetical protein